MTRDAAPSGLIVPADSTLYRRLDHLAHTARLVFFAGLPGTGKSLLVHQLAHLAQEAGRQVHLLQWDTARPVFEACPASAPYPLVEGVTHAVIRKAVGLWVRPAVSEWVGRHPERGHLLVGETPLVGHRFIDLVRPDVDAAEAILIAPGTVFVIPVPSREVRRFVVAERARRAAAPLHPREREDAPPHVLEELWRALAGVAAALGMTAPVAGPRAEVPFDPDLYRRVYEHLLRHRPVEVLPVDFTLPSTTLSVYDLAGPRHVLPTPEEAARFIRDVEGRHPDAGALQREIDRWYVG